MWSILNRNGQSDPAINDWFKIYISCMPDVGRFETGVARLRLHRFPQLQTLRNVCIC
jgi:hypothetical protein